MEKNVLEEISHLCEFHAEEVRDRNPRCVQRADPLEWTDLRRAEPVGCLLFGLGQDPNEPLNSSEKLAPPFTPPCSSPSFIFTTL